MRYIRSCPSCNMELRFPLDMGILIITCPHCKASFRMDPDDPKTYYSGNFDLSPVKKNLPFPFLDRMTNYIYSTKDIRFLIPIFLFLILLLNLLKIFNSPDETQKENLEKEKQEFFKDIEPDKPSPENNREPEKPSLEI